MATYAVKLGPPEYFMLMVLAFCTVSAVLGKSTLRGLTALFIGLAMGLVGIDQISGQARYTGGVPELMDGLEVVLIAVGLFAVGECSVRGAVRGPCRRDAEQDEQGPHDRRRVAPLVAGLAARHLHRVSVRHHSGGRQRDPDLPELCHREETLARTRKSSAPPARSKGVAGPEAANNAAVTATLIPLLTLGIPTSNTTAILLGAFQNYGIQPGPQLFDKNASLVWALIASMYIGNVMLLILNLPLVGLWVKLLKIPKPHLYAGILIFATVGVYGMRQSAFDLVLLYAIGLLGVVMRRFDFPDRAGRRGHDPRAAGRGADAQRAVDRRRQVDGVRRAPDVGDAAGRHGGPAGVAAGLVSCVRRRACGWATRRRAQLPGAVRRVAPAASARERCAASCTGVGLDASCSSPADVRIARCGQRGDPLMAGRSGKAM